MRNVDPKLPLLNKEGLGNFGFVILDADWPRRWNQIRNPREKGNDQMRFLVLLSRSLSFAMLILSSYDFLFSGTNNRSEKLFKVLSLLYVFLISIFSSSFLVHRQIHFLI